MARHRVPTDSSGRAPHGDLPGQEPSGEAKALVGTTIDRYVLQSVVGEGGFGIVFRAEHMVTGRPVALKVLHRTRTVQPKAVKRFVREARATGAVGHPGIVDVLDAGTTEEGIPFLALELLEGETLRARIDRQGMLAPAELTPLSRQLFEALQVAHEHGIVHRDLKPENLFICTDGDREQLKVLDFGVSKFARRDSERLTTAGHAFGTPLYMAPEQFLGSDETDHRADLYSAAAVLYEALCGMCPFEELQDITELLDAIHVRDPMPLAQRNPAIPELISDVLQRGLARDPAGRFPDASAFGDALQRALDDVDVSQALLDEPTYRQPSSPAGAVGRAVGLVSATTEPDGTRAFPSRGERKPARWKLVALGVAMVAGGAAGGWAVMIAFQPPPVEPGRPPAATGRSEPTAAVEPLPDNGETASESEPIRAEPSPVPQVAGMNGQATNRLAENASVARPPRLSVRIEGHPDMVDSLRASLPGIMPTLRRCTRNYRGRFRVRTFVTFRRVYSSEPFPNTEVPGCVAVALFKLPVTHRHPGTVINFHFASR